MKYPHNEWIILEKLVGVILENVPGCIVEIGSGVSTLVLSDQAKLFNVKLYTCDSMLNQIKYVTEKINYDNLVTFYGKSRDFMKVFDDKPSVVLLDGSHRFHVVKYEFDFFLDKLNIGGVIFLHDTCPWEKTVNKKKLVGKNVDTYLIRKELELNKSLDVFTWPYTASKCGLTMALKKDMSVPEYRR